MLPWVKNPEENPVFQVHFTRQWQDNLLVSLHNLLAAIFQCMPQPVLVSFEEDAQKMKRLQEENEALRLRVVTLLENARNNVTSVSDVTAPEVPQPAELMDDFYVIALETSSVAGESQAKTLKSLIRNIGSGLPTSPMLGRKVLCQSTSGAPGKVKMGGSGRTEEQQQLKKHSSVKQQQRAVWTAAGKTSSAEGVASKRQSSTEQPVTRPTRDPSVETPDRRVKYQQQPITCQAGSALSNTGAFLLLSQEEYVEHRAPVCHCRFNSSGSTVVSADVDGIVKLWTVTPTPKTLATFASKSAVMSLDWVTKNERYFIGGNKQGLVRLYDTRDNRIVWELGADTVSPLKDARIMTICCSPVEPTFICSVAPPVQASGKLLLFDIKTKKLEMSLTLDCAQSATVATCCTFNHNGQLLVTGCNDGVVRIFDLRRSECIDSWTAHQGETLAIQLTADFTACYTLGSDGKLCQRSLNQSGQALWEATLQNCPPLCNLGVPHGQLFAFDPPGTHVLTCGHNGGTIYQICGSGLSRMLELGGHRSPTLAVDWAIANQCATCVTASSGDGKIKVSTLLTP
ncbi:WD repeat-containing protein 91 isoform X2 [Cryptotermes secundus]|nr:WD repeat-containing protein 91 isoform X2 [Cryptotermes secundus]